MKTQVPFIPAVYDLKPSLVGADLAAFGADAGELVRAVLREYELFSAHALTVAYDIYNVEVEAAGGAVHRSAGAMPDITGAILAEAAGWRTLPPVTAHSGRIPVFLAAAQEVRARLPAAVAVRGAVTGPASLASGLLGRQEFLMAAITEPEPVGELLDWCAEVAITCAQGYIAAGTGVVVFDSFSAPPHLSPSMYRDLILPRHRQVMSALERAGVTWRPLVVGGDVRSILPDLARSGATQLILDFVIPLEDMPANVEAYPHLAFRLNLFPALIVSAPEEVFRATVQRYLEYCRTQPRVILGTGILPPATPLERLRWISGQARGD